MGLGLQGGNAPDMHSSPLCCPHPRMTSVAKLSLQGIRWQMVASKWPDRRWVDYAGWFRDGDKFFDKLWL